MLTIEEISAHIEIRQVPATYSRGVDRWDAEMLKSVYHPDAIDTHTVFNGTGWEFADFIVATCREMGGVSQHHLTNIYIELHGDFANVETYYIAYHQGTNKATGEQTLLNTGGRYLDRFERRAGVWKVADRLVTIDWSRKHVLGEPWPGAAAFPAVGPKGADPMYALFNRRAIPDTARRD
jgi:SnoaL-like domain